MKGELILNLNRLINSKKSDEKGAVLVSVLMVSLVLIILSGTLAMLSLSEAKETTLAIDKTQAYYVAKSGVEIAVLELEKRTEQAGELAIPLELEGQIEGNNYSVVVGGGLEKIIIESTGTVGAQKETLIHVLKGESEGSGGVVELLPDMALFADGKIELSGSAQITGDVVTNSEEANSIIVSGGGTKIDGDVGIGVNGVDDEVIKIDGGGNITGLIYNLDAPISKYSVPVLPPFPETLSKPPNHEAINDGKLIVPYQSYTLTEDAYFDEITISSGRTLNIDVGNEERIIRTKKLDIQQGSVKLIGTGKLTIYVDDYFAISGSSTLNALGNSDKVIIYYNGNKEVTFPESIQMFAAFYSGPADLTITGSGKINGNIISAGENINITGSGSVNSVLIYAPNANVNLQGSGNVKGSIIAKNFKANGGGAKIEYNSSSNLKPVPIITSDQGDGNTSFTRGLWK